MILESPLINPLRFVPVGAPLDPRYNTTPFDGDWFHSRILEWQAKTDYCQKWQINDVITHQLSSTSVSQFRLDLIDLSNNVLHTWQSDFPSYIPNTTILFNGLNAVAVTTKLTFSFSQVVGLNDGIYFLKLTQPSSLEPDYIMISEPLSIAAVQSDTMLLEYWNSYNAQDIPFAITGTRFSIRSEMAILELSSLSKDNQFEDQNYNMRLLSSLPYRQFKYVLGSNGRMPEWLVDKVNRAWSCDNTYVDGVRYSKENAAKWEYNRVKGAPKVQANLLIREYYNNQGGIFGDSGFAIGSVPAYSGSPYAVANGQMVNAGGALPLFSSWVIRSEADRAALLAYLNVTVRFATGNSLSGYFYYGVDTLKYSNGLTENYTTGSAVIYTKKFVLSRSPFATGFYFGLTITGAGVAGWNGTQSDVFSGNTNHTYSSAEVAAGFNVEVYHQDTITAFGVNHAYLGGITGLLPATLHSLSITNSIVLSTFDFNVLAACAATLQTLTVTGNLLSTIPHFSIPFANLTSIDFGANTLTSMSAGNIIVGFDTGAFFIPSGGTLNTAGQYPAAPPTGAASSISDLTGTHSWSVSHD